MFDAIDLTQKLKTKDYKKLLDSREKELGLLQRLARQHGVPAIIVVEGWGTSGKGLLINRLIANLDPRGFTVFTIKDENEEESRRPFLWRFWTKIPQKGRIAIFDRSWYRRVLNDYIDRKAQKQNLHFDYKEINSFEKNLTDDGIVLIKLFLHISKDEQKKRIKILMENKETAWRVTPDDLKHHNEYGSYLEATEKMIRNTNTPDARWTIIEANDLEYATIKMYDTVIASLRATVERRRAETEKPPTAKTVTLALPEHDRLSRVDLSLDLPKDEYRRKLKEHQTQLAALHNLIYLNKIPVVIVMEGWDAGGKGGAIKRFTEPLDPRGYEVFSIPAPTKDELEHHYLWRFWNKLPKDGHIAVFDRSWYGRVLVEKVEGFCTAEEYARAFEEINQFETHILNWGAVLVKFWLHISPQEQERRFKERAENPLKSWKLTEEDWRNREKWNDYTLAAERMFQETDTKQAPWHIVPGDSKRYARVDVIRTIVSAIKRRL